MVGGGRNITMAKRRRHTPEQIVRKLREADRLLARRSEHRTLHLPAERGELVAENHDLQDLLAGSGGVRWPAHAGRGRISGEGGLKAPGRLGFCHGLRMLWPADRFEFCALKGVQRGASLTAPERDSNPAVTRTFQETR